MTFKNSQVASLTHGVERDQWCSSRCCYEGTYGAWPGTTWNVSTRNVQHKLQKRGLKVECEVWLPVVYDGTQIEGGYKVDLVVERSVIVELKVVEHLLEVHKAQLLSYLKLSDKELGLLINFNVVHLKDGIKRIVNSSPSASSAVVG